MNYAIEAKNLTKKFKNFEETTEFVTQDETNTTITIVGTNVDLKTRENYESLF